MSQQLSKNKNLEAPKNNVARTATEEIKYFFVGIIKVFLFFCELITKVILLLLGVIKFCCLFLIEIYIEILLGIIKTLFFPHLMKTHHEKIQTLQQVSPTPIKQSEEQIFIFPNDYSVTEIGLCTSDIDLVYFKEFSEIFVILQNAKNTWSFYLTSSHLDTICEKIKTPSIKSDTKMLVPLLVYICRSLLCQHKLGTDELSKLITTTNKQGIKTEINIVQKISNVANGLSQTSDDGLKPFIKKVRSIIGLIQTKTAPQEWSQIHNLLIDLENSLSDADKVYFPNNAHLINNNK